MIPRSEIWQLVGYSIRKQTYLWTLKTNKATELLQVNGTHAPEKPIGVGVWSLRQREGRVVLTSFHEPGLILCSKETPLSVGLSLLFSWKSIYQLSSFYFFLSLEI